jgi:hypothetical protein
MHNPAVDSLPACLRFSNMNNPAFDSLSACLRFSNMNSYVLKYLLNLLCTQNVSPSPSNFQWKGQLFFQAQPRLAAFILQTASRQSRAHNHRLLSALLNGPIDQAGPRLVSVLRDQTYLAVSSAEQIVALAAFHLSPDTGGVQLAPSVMVPSVIVTDDMRIALADDIIERTARLALIGQDKNPDLFDIARYSLAIRTQRFSEWAVNFRAASPPTQATGTLSRAAGRSRSPPAIPHRPRPVSHRMVSIATLSDESDHDAHLYLAGSSELNASVTLSSSDILLSSSALPPIPCLGGWGSGLISLREKAVSELQQMDAVPDPVLFDLMSSNSNYVQKAELVTLKWREIISIGRATALWALLF